jgi:alkylation response protein AidB-like acyl-CoA dehydrogenase
MAETTSAQLSERVDKLLAEHPPASTDRMDFLHARFDAGLAWVHFPPGLGGLGLPRGMQPRVDRALSRAGAPDNDPSKIGIGIGMAAPTILAFGNDEQKQRYLRKLWCGEEVWCQLFSEPGAGSDLAGLATRAVLDGDTWIVNGQKVWTSSAHIADRAIMIARTDPDQVKHAGLSYFTVNMHDPGVEVRPLRQITGEAEFNEVFLTGVRIPDADRLGAVGDGWKVANATLSNERVSIGGSAAPREYGAISNVAKTWRARPELRTPQTHDRLLRGWIDTEVMRISANRLRQKLAAGAPGPEGSAMKLSFARINQQLTGLELDLLADDALTYSGWEVQRPARVDFFGKDAGYRYLRAKGNSIEGGTSEILRNVIAERVLGLPIEPRVDKDIPWKDLKK